MDTDTEPTDEESGTLILQTMFGLLEVKTHLAEQGRETTPTLYEVQCAVDLAIELLEDIVPLPDELSSRPE